MQVWEKDYLDLEVPAYITFGADQLGEFQFGTVRGWIDYREIKRGSERAVEFSWEGDSEGDHSCGRGWVVLEGAVLVGHLFIHQGDDSAFRARRFERRAG
jgi:hypothetical protein